MTVQPIPRVPTTLTAPQLSTRADRMVHPLTLDALRQLAAKHGACSHPVVMRRTDLASGHTEVLDLRCGATREKKCPAGAKRAKRLREEQLRQGWHRDDEPCPQPEANDEQVALLELRAQFEYLRADCLAKAEWHHIAELDEGIAEVEALIRASGLRGRTTADKPNDKTAAIAAAVARGEEITGVVQPTGPETAADNDCPSTVGGSGEDAHAGAGHGETGSGSGRRVRSTRRRQDAPNLPRNTVESRTVGRTFHAPNGKVFRPSTFVTLTLPSYGRVRDDGPRSTPTATTAGVPRGTRCTSPP